MQRWHDVQTTPSLIIFNNAKTVMYHMSLNDLMIVMQPLRQIKKEEIHSQFHKDYNTATRTPIIFIHTIQRSVN